jgi:AcrR family transcriptional regulator
MRAAASTNRRDHGRTDPVRVRILTAAQELFAEHGYRATTTKQISLRANVAEPTLFRHFGSKADLFEATILEPFSSFVEEWTGSWNDFPAEASLDDMAERLVEGLFRLVRGDRRLFQDLIAARSDPDSDLHASAVAISARLRIGLRSVQDVGLDIAAAQGLAGMDPPATIGAVSAMVIGAVLLEDWIYPAGTRVPSQRRIVREISALVVHGIAHRPARPA